MKQISNDKLLNITSQPTNTCPLINALQYTGSQRSRIIRFSIDSYDNNATMHPSELKSLYTTMKALDSWAEDVISVCEKLASDLPEELLEAMQDEMYEDTIATIQKELNKYYIDSIEEDSDKVNKCAEEIENIIDSYNTKDNEISSLENEKDQLSRKYGEDAETNESIDDDINELDKQIEYLESEKDTLKKEFRYAEIAFDNVSDAFSDFLEIVRLRNEKLRNHVRELKNLIITVGIDYLELAQPLETLNNKFKNKKDKILNVGIVSSGSLSYYDNLMKHLLLFDNIESESFNRYKEIKSSYINGRNKDVEAFKEKYGYEKATFFSGENMVNYLTEEVSKKGHKGIRYYLTEDDYLADKESYKISLAPEKNKNKAKVKI